MAGAEAAAEDDRLEALRRYDILDTPPEEAFDRLTRLARRLFDVPISTITFLDAHRQWFKSCPGLDARETERGPAFCRVALAEPGLLVIRDALADERFRQNPFVVGEPHIRFYAGAPLRSPEGHALGTICVIDRRPREFGPADMESLSDLGTLAINVLELRQHVVTDALTGALSRRAFRHEADRAIALARRHGQDLACLMLDLDHFKSINDRHGHATGDRALRACVAACRGALRGSDAIGRMGGEEFAVLLPMTRPSGAREVAERVRHAIAATRIESPLGPIAITASIGLAVFDRDMADTDELLAHADEALLRAKRGGRNRVVIAARRSDAAGSASRRVLKAGRLAFNLGHSAIDCTIRRLSDEEAAVDVISTAGIPDELKLHIDSDGVSRSCRVAAREDRHLVLAFR